LVLSYSVSFATQPYLLHIRIAEGKSEIEPDTVDNSFGSLAVAMIEVGIFARGAVSQKLLSLIALRQPDNTLAWEVLIPINSATHWLRLNKQ